MKTKTCPIMEAIAKKLIGIDSVPVGERAKMIKRAAKAGADAVKKQLETELAEARAEIENWKREADEAADRAVRMCNASTGAIEALEANLKAARAEIERLQAELEHSIETSTALAALAINKDRLIEQMYEAIKSSLIADEVRQSRSVCASDINDACEVSRIKRIAALSAAERGE